MNTSTRSLIALSFFGLFVPTTYASVSVQWSTPFESGSQIDFRGITVGASGESWISSSTSLSHVTPGGSIDFTQPISGGRIISSSGSGPLYIGTDSSLVRYSTSGTFLGSTAFTGLGRFDVNAFAANSSGVIATGQTITANQGNAFLSKYDPSGTLLWQNTAFGTSDADTGTGLAFDASGNLYLGGWTFGTLPGGISHGEADSFVAKFTSTGTLLWQTQIGTTNGDYAYVLTADSAGNTYIAGGYLPVIGGVGSSDSSAFLTKLDSSGTPLWNRYFGGSGYDEAKAVGIDSLGNIWIGGTSQAESGRNPFVAEYSPTGTLLGSYFFDTASGGAIQALAANPSGGVTAVGYAAGLYSVPSKGITDPFVAKVVPEPCVGILLAGGLSGLAVRRRVAA